MTRYHLHDRGFTAILIKSLPFYDIDSPESKQSLLKQEDQVFARFYVWSLKGWTLVCGDLRQGEDEVVFCDASQKLRFGIMKAKSGRRQGPYSWWDFSDHFLSIP